MPWMPPPGFRGLRTLPSMQISSTRTTSPQANAATAQTDPDRATQPIDKLSPSSQDRP